MKKFVPLLLVLAATAIFTQTQSHLSLDDSLAILSEGHQQVDKELEWVKSHSHELQALATNKPSPGAEQRVMGLVAELRTRVTQRAAALREPRYHPEAEKLAQICLDRYQTLQESLDLAEELIPFVLDLMEKVNNQPDASLATDFEEKAQSFSKRGAELSQRLMSLKHDFNKELERVSKL